MVIKLYFVHILYVFLKFRVEDMHFLLCNQVHKTRFTLSLVISGIAAIMHLRFVRQKQSVIQISAFSFH